MSRIEFEILGKAIPKARPRASKFGVFTPKETRNYERLTAYLAQAEMEGVEIMTGAVEVGISIYTEIPRSWPRWKADLAQNGELFHTKKPDIDNVIKSIIDGMNTVVYLDDSQIFNIHTIKAYSIRPRVSVYVTEWAKPHSGITTKKDLDRWTQ